MRPSTNEKLPPASCTPYCDIPYLFVLLARKNVIEEVAYPPPLLGTILDQTCYYGQFDLVAKYVDLKIKKVASVKVESKIKVLAPLIKAFISSSVRHKVLTSVRCRCAGELEFACG